jgi:AcrR family transcriptional regulator
MSGPNLFAGREVKSRRSGNVKEPLSRDRIVDEALTQLRRNGLEGMSLRAVAMALETGPASLYVYVDDLASLRALVLDRALSRVRTVVNRGGWRSRLNAVLESYARVLLGTPGLAQLALSTIAAGPNALRVIEALLEALEEGGLDTGTAAWAVDLLLLYVTAISAEQSQRDPAISPTGPIARALSVVSSREFPRVHAAREELLSGKGKARFEWALETLVTGVLNNQRGSTRAMPRSKGKRRNSGERHSLCAAPRINQL